MSGLNPAFVMRAIADMLNRQGNPGHKHMIGEQGSRPYPKPVNMKTKWKNDRRVRK